MSNRRIFGREARAKALHDVEQAAILVLSAVAIAMVNLGPSDRWRFWGNVFGLVAAPLWFHTSWVARQWGQFILSFAYLAIWIAGVVKYA